MRVEDLLFYQSVSFVTSDEREDAGRMREDLLLPRVLLLPTGFRPLVARRKMEKTCKMDESTSYYYYLGQFVFVGRHER